MCVRYSSNVCMDINPLVRGLRDTYATFSWPSPIDVPCQRTVMICVISIKIVNDKANRSQMELSVSVYRRRRIAEGELQYAPMLHPCRPRLKDQQIPLVEVLIMSLQFFYAHSVYSGRGSQACFPHKSYCPSVYRKTLTVIHSHRVATVIFVQHATKITTANFDLHTSTHRGKVGNSTE